MAWRDCGNELFPPFCFGPSGNIICWDDDGVTRADGRMDQSGKKKEMPRARNLQIYTDPVEGKRW